MGHTASKDSKVISRLLENQILFEESVKDTPDDIYDSEILTPPWNTSQLKEIKERVDQELKYLYEDLDEFTEHFPEFGQQIKDIVKDTHFEIEAFKSFSMVEGSYGLYTIGIEDPSRQLYEQTKMFNKEQKIIEERVKEFADEGNPAGSVIWYYGTGIITLTGWM